MKPPRPKVLRASCQVCGRREDDTNFCIVCNPTGARSICCPDCYDRLVRGYNRIVVGCRIARKRERLWEVKSLKIQEAIVPAFSLLAPNPVPLNAGGHVRIRA